MVAESAAPLRRVLVVDDKPNNLSLVTSLLRSSYEILLANQGERAIHMAREKKPDLILLDIMMPGMSGFDVCRILKEDAATRDIPVIFLTARHDGEDFEMAYDIGAVDYITKPINAKELIARVRTHLTISEQRASLIRLNENVTRANENLEAEVRKRTTELVHVLASLEDKNEDLSRFSHIISHNLRGPVASVLGLVGLFNADRPDDPGNVPVIQRIGESVRNIDMILKDLSTILDIRDNPSRPAERIEVQSELQKVADEHRPLLEETGGSISISTDVQVVSLHRPFLHQILHQLVHNALQFRSPDRKPDIHLSVRRGDVHPMIVFGVQDNGIGISSADLRRVFEPYKRLHYSVGGRGLGLYTARAMAQALHGDLFVSSDPGSGSLFSLQLPEVLGNPV